MVANHDDLRKFSAVQLAPWPGTERRRLDERAVPRKHRCRAAGLGLAHNIKDRLKATTG